MVEVQVDAETQETIRSSGGKTQLEMWILWVSIKYKDCFNSLDEVGVGFSFLEKPAALGCQSALWSSLFRGQL